ncbi:MAG: ribonuclease HII [Treponema sp.]|nr:ribonuclease HII [Treponema sp.]MCI5666238.1 ribonuclease HII [Spirochaetia bacterium]MDD7767719.1 ribonuclease HII [Treponema sp.]MDY3130739.1 ribonuclease HII [Treponema sp.]
MVSKLLLVGFDEAGRGPLAGPVSAAAVILPDDFPNEILNDSKKLSEKKREAAEKIIKEKACWGIGLVDHEKIDEINILEASMLAMKIAFENLTKMLPQWLKGQNINDYILNGITDGTRCPDVAIEIKWEPKADGKYPCVMAASILAKTCRDRIMVEMDKKYPGYGYAKHKGYPTRDHKEICHKLGPSPIQRLSFKY